MIICATCRIAVRSGRVRRVVIDNNGIDPIADIPGAYAAVRAAIDRGDLEILYVHTTLTEVANTPDKDRRDQLRLTLVNLGKPVTSYGFVFDESLLGQAAPTDEPGAADLEALASDHLDHQNNRRDALVANTAKANGWAVVTNESRLRKRAAALGVEALRTEALLAEIGFVTA
jgi:predicted nucleic acid-binding protein